MPRGRRYPFHPHMRRLRGMSEIADPNEPNGRYLRLQTVKWERRRLEKRGRMELGDLGYLTCLLDVGHQELMEMLELDWGPDLEN